jgi:hypothetical protein
MTRRFGIKICRICNKKIKEHTDKQLFKCYSEAIDREGKATKIERDLSLVVYYRRKDKGEIKNE